MGASASICGEDEFIDIHATFVIDESNQLMTNVPIQLSQSLLDEQIGKVSNSFPKHGVKLRHYDEFVQLCGGRNRLKGLTTTDVCDQFIKPMTMNIQGSYCDLLTQQDHPAVGPARVFISHAWKYKFLDVMDALLYHFRNDTSIIIWFDLFSNNQHCTMDHDFSWWSNTFKSAIAEFGHTVMVFAPWNDPIPLTRAWCLFELYCTIQNACKFDIAMCKEQTRQFFDDMALHGREKVNTMFASIHTESSECYKREDQEKILQVVRETVGFEKVNQMILDRFRAWVIKTTIGEIRHALDDVSAIRERKHRVIRLKHTIADLYAGQGKQVEAEPMYEECISLCKRYFGDEHPETLTQMYQLIHFYVNNGNIAKAFFVVLEFLSIGQSILGGRHDMILETIKLKASLSLQMETDMTRVELAYREVIAHMKTYFGDIHRHTLEAIYACSSFCIDHVFPALLSATPSLSITSGLSSIGIMARRPSMETSPILLSTNTTNTASSSSSGQDAMFPIYDTLLLDRRFPEVERMLMSTMQQCRQSLCVEDSLLLSTIHLVTRLYLMQGKYVQAEKVYIEQCKWYDNHLGELKHQPLHQQLQQLHQQPVDNNTGAAPPPPPAHVQVYTPQTTHPYLLECMHHLLPIYLATKQYILYEYYLSVLLYRETAVYGCTHTIPGQTKQLLDTFYTHRKIHFDSSDIWITEYIESYKPCILEDPNAAFFATSASSSVSTAVSSSYVSSSSSSAVAASLAAAGIGGASSSFSGSMTNPIASLLATPTTTTAATNSVPLSSSPNSVTWLPHTTTTISPPPVTSPSRLFPTKSLAEDLQQIPAPSPSRSGKRSFTFGSASTSSNGSISSTTSSTDGAQQSIVNMISDLYEKRRKLYGKTHTSTLYALGQLAYANTLLHCPPPSASTTTSNNMFSLSAASSSLKNTTITTGSNNNSMYNINSNNSNNSVSSSVNSAQMKMVEGLWKDCYEKKKANLSSTTSSLLYSDTKAILDTYETLHDYTVFLHTTPQPPHKSALAKTYYEDCLPAFLTYYGPSHPTTCLLYHNLGNLCVSLQLFSQATTYYLACLQGKKDACAQGSSSNKHPKVIQAYLAVILVHIQCHAYEAAEQCILEALMLFHNDHLHIPMMMNGGGGMRNHHQHQHHSSSATAAVSAVSLVSSSFSPERRILSSSTRSSKKHHPSPSRHSHKTTTTTTTSSSNSNSKTVFLSEEEESERVNLFPKARLIMYLGNIYVYQGKYRPAEKMFKDAIPYVEKYLGYAHPDVVESRENLRLIRRMKHDPAYALSQAHQHT